MTYMGRQRVILVLYLLSKNKCIVIHRLLTFEALHKFHNYFIMTLRDWER